MTTPPPALTGRHRRWKAAFGFSAVGLAAAIIATLAVTSVAATLALGDSRMNDRTPAASNTSTTTPVALGLAGAYSVFASTAITNTVQTKPETVLHGNMGLSPGSSITGFPPGQVNGETHKTDDAASLVCHDVETAYNDAASRASTSAITANLAGETLDPGVYRSQGPLKLSGILTLDAGGDPDAVFIIQARQTLQVSTSSVVQLTGGAVAGNVFWQVAQSATIGDSATFVGTILGQTDIAIGHQTTINGRALAGSAVTLDLDTFTSMLSVTIDGGKTALTNQAEPLITGTSSDQPGRPLTVTVGGDSQQTYIRKDGSWSVKAGPLGDGATHIDVSITDAAGNSASASQNLTVDTRAPSVSIAGGSDATSDSSTPTILGTTDAKPGSTMSVTIGDTQRSAVVDSSGSWQLTYSPLANGTYTVSASIRDDAGNTGTASQRLTVNSSS